MEAAVKMHMFDIAAVKAIDQCFFLRKGRIGGVLFRGEASLGVLVGITAADQNEFFGRTNGLNKTGILMDVLVKLRFAATVDARCVKAGSIVNMEHTLFFLAGQNRSSALFCSQFGALQSRRTEEACIGMSMRNIFLKSASNHTHGFEAVGTVHVAFGFFGCTNKGGNGRGVAGVDVRVTCSFFQGAGEGSGGLIAGIIMLVTNDFRQAADQGAIFVIASISMGMTFQFFQSAGQGLGCGIASIGMEMCCHLGLGAQQILRFGVTGLGRMGVRCSFGDRADKILLRRITGVQVRMDTSLFHRAEEFAALLPAAFVMNVCLNLRQNTGKLPVLTIAMVAMGMQHKISDAAHQLAVFVVTFDCMGMDP